ncbi:hypothetical protein D3C78_1759780 [compost metagenome]
MKPTSPAGAFMRFCMPLMSPPAQKPLPAPVSTRALTALSAATRSSASMNSVRMSSLMALRLSGRFRVMVATASVTCS